MKKITLDELTDEPGDMKKGTVEDLNLSDEPLIGADADWADWPNDVGDSIWDWINEPSPVQPGTTLH
jgi:hypothetical protein